MIWSVQQAYDFVQISIIFVIRQITWENLKLIPKDQYPRLDLLKETHQTVLMNGLDGIIFQTLQKKIWETPLLLSSFLKKGETTVNSYWSKRWVQQRIVPTDRQNLTCNLNKNESFKVCSDCNYYDRHLY